MPVNVYNTLTRRKEPLFPPQERPLSIYVCGVTVYDLSHIGHARSAIAFDVAVRYLRHRGYTVRYVRNFTDVDDKIIRRGHELGVEPLALASDMIDAYHQDMDAVGCVRPDLEPRVTDTMDAIVSLVERIVANGKAYEVDGDVYFRVRDCPGYGKLSGRNLDDQRDGARVEVDERLRDPKDFALWKAAKPGEPSWASPWGPGRPGWHIECSAMNLEHIGPTTDIHGGGKDLVFPHHENEIAQSEAATGIKPWVRWWMHNGFINVVRDGVEEKMAKSLGNFSTIRDALEQTPAEVLRLLMVSTHYRKDLAYGAEVILEAQRRLAYIYETLARLDEALGGKEAWADAAPDEAVVAAFRDAMDDDLNVPAGLAQLSGLLREANEVAAPGAKPDAPQRARAATARRTVDVIGEVLGLFQQDPGTFLADLKARATAELPLDEARIEAFIAERKQARAERNWARADEIRDELKAKGIVLKDSREGTTWFVEGSQ